MLVCCPQGYGITLATINGLSVLASVLESIPSLGLQAVTLVVWTAARYFLYASYFTIFGVLFGFKNFGKMVAIDNTFNGLIGVQLFPHCCPLQNCEDSDQISLHGQRQYRRHAVMLVAWTA